MKHFIPFVALLCATLVPALGQSIPRIIGGTIVNAETRKAIIAVSIENTDNKTGTYTDKYGKFSLHAAKFPVQIKVSHIGYASQTISCDSSDHYIELVPIVLHAEEVLVSAHRAISGKTPIAFSTLERKDIDRLYHQQDVPMVLDMEPGVYAYSDAGNGIGYTYLSIRGFTQDRIGVMYNGVPLNDPEAHAVYWVDHGDVLSDASDIQVQRGIGNSLSSTAFGGSVNIESDISKLDPGVKASIAYGNYIDRNNLNAPSEKRSIAYTGKPFPEQGISFSFRLSDLNSAGYRIGSGTDQQSAHVAMQWMQPTHMTRVEYLWGNQVTNFSWDGVSPQYGFDLDDMNDRRYNFYADTSYQGGYSDVNQDVFTQSLLFVNHTHILSENSKIYATLYYVNGKGYYQQFKGEADPDEFNVRSAVDDTNEVDLICRKWLDNHYIGSVYHYTFSQPKYMLTLGGDFRLYASKHYGEVLFIEDYGYVGSEHRFYNNATKKSSFSFYIQDLITLNEKFFIQGDIRYLMHRYEVQQDTVGIFTNPFHFIIPYHFFDGRVGLRYNITDRLSSYVNISTSKREPSSNDLYDDNDPNVPAAVVNPYGGTVTDPLISHESLVDIEWGLDYITEDINFALNAYRMDFRNELIPVYYRYRDTDDVLRGNAPKTLHQGIEFALHVPIHQFDIHANMNLSDNHFVEFTADSLGWGGFGGIADYAGKTIPAFPSFQMKARIFYNYKIFQPWFNIKYIGKQYIDFMNTESSAIPAYWVADIGVRVPFKVLGMRHVIDIRVNNLFNVLYETFGYSYYNSPDERIDNYWPAATRNFYLNWSLMFNN